MPSCDAQGPRAEDAMHFVAERRIYSSGSPAVPASPTGTARAPRHSLVISVAPASLCGCARSSIAGAADQDHGRSLRGLFAASGSAVSRVPLTIVRTPTRVRTGVRHSETDAAVPDRDGFVDLVAERSPGARLENWRSSVTGLFKLDRCRASHGQTL